MCVFFLLVHWVVYSLKIFEKKKLGVSSKITQLFFIRLNVISRYMSATRTRVWLLYKWKRHWTDRIRIVSQYCYYYCDGCSVKVNQTISGNRLISLPLPWLVIVLCVKCHWDDHQIWNCWKDSNCRQCQTHPNAKFLKFVRISWVRTKCGTMYIFLLFVLSTHKMKKVTKY